LLEVGTGLIMITRFPLQLYTLKMTIVKGNCYLMICYYSSGLITVLNPEFDSLMVYCTDNPELRFYYLRSIESLIDTIIHPIQGGILRIVHCKLLWV